MKKHIFRTLFALFMVAIVILPLLPKPKTEEEYTYAAEMAYRESYTDEHLIYLYNKDGTIAELAACSQDGFYLDFSLERNSALIIPDVDYDIGGTLYHADAEGAVPIATGVYNAFASDNYRCAFLTRPEGQGYHLQYFDGKEIVCIEPQLGTQLNNLDSLSLAISPDGKTVA